MADTVVDLAGLFSGTKRHKDVDFNLDMSDVELNKTYPFSEDIDVRAKFSAGEFFLKLEVQVRFSFSYPCDRCADMINQTKKYHFEHKVAEDLNNRVNDDYIIADNDKLNLSKLIREDILLELPSKILCSESCKGICPTCGQNLNKGRCSCETRVVDPRLEKLRDALA